MNGLDLFGGGPVFHLPEVRKSSKASSYFLSNFLAIIVRRGGLDGAGIRCPGRDPKLAQPGEKHDTGATNASSNSQRESIVKESVLPLTNEPRNGFL